MGRLDGKVAVVTGAASGIGRAVALLFAREGAKVVVADIQEEKARQVVQEIIDGGGAATFVKTDVSQPKDVEAMIKATQDTYGRLDILVNNAGILGDVGATADCSLENWEQVINTNLKGVFLGMKYGIPAMLKSGGGSIINTASVAALIGEAYFPAYGASKGGVLQLTKTAALEYARQGIRVNALCPGGTVTNIGDHLGAQLEGAPEQVLLAMAAKAEHPLGRLAQPEEQARMALFLASDDSSFCTGAAFLVDGGRLAT